MAAGLAGGRYETRILEGCARSSEGDSQGHVRDVFLGLLEMVASIPRQPRTSGGNAKVAQEVAGGHGMGPTVSTVRVWRKNFRREVEAGRVKGRRTITIVKNSGVPVHLVAFWRQKKSYVNFDDPLHKAWLLRLRTRMLAVER